MKRIENWDVELILWAREIKGSAFAWGKTDCASLVRTASQIMFDVDVFSHVGHWTSEFGARRVLAEYKEPADIMKVVADWVHSNFAQTGDIAVTPGTDALGFPRFSVILTGGQALVSIPESGVAVVPRWRETLDSTTMLYRIRHG